MQFSENVKAVFSCKWTIFIQDKNKKIVVLEEERRLEIIQDVHAGIGESSHATAMSSHLGKTPTYEKIGERFYWYGIVNDIAEFVKKCEPCQKQNSLLNNLKNELHSIPVPSQVMAQVGLIYVP